jgi:hypothetical protein
MARGTNNDNHFFEQKWSKRKESKVKKAAHLCSRKMKIFDKEHFYVNDRSGTRFLSVCNFTTNEKKMQIFSQN